MQLDEYQSYIKLYTEYQKLLEIKNNYKNILELNRLDVKLRNINNIITRYQNKIIINNQRLVKLCMDLNMLSDKLNDYDKNVHKRYVYDLYVKCLSLSKKPGIPFHMMQQLLKILSNSINEILTDVVNFKMKFELDKKKNMINVIQLKKIGNKMVSSKIWSGFEEIILDLAFRISVVKNHDYYPNILMIDEGFAAADSSNLSKLIDVLNHISKSNVIDWMIIISHVLDIQNISSNLLTINRMSGISELCNANYRNYIPDYINL